MLWRIWTFSDIAQNADKLAVEFDVRMNGGRWQIALADLSKRPGASNRTNYDKIGTAFYFGTKDGTNLSINNELVWHSETVGAWIHVKAVIDCEKRQLEYSITVSDTGTTAVIGTAAFSDTGCSAVTGIELYSWAQSVIDVNNVHITASGNINESNLYFVRNGDTYDLYFYHNGVPELAAQSHEEQEYSTVPTRIGTWIDGTPVWRFAFELDWDAVRADTVHPGVIYFNSIGLSPRGNGSIFMLINSHCEVCRKDSDGTICSDIIPRYTSSAIDSDLMFDTSTMENEVKNQCH